MTKGELLRALEPFTDDIEIVPEMDPIVLGRTVIQICPSFLSAHYSPQTGVLPARVQLKIGKHCET